MIRKVLFNIELTPNCPARCSICPRHVVTDRGFMKVSFFEDLIKKINSSLAWEIAFAGRGEPTIHPEFSEFLKIASTSDVPVCAVTTGVNFNDENIKACELYADKVRLSVSSIKKDIFEKVHIGLNYDSVWKNIKNFSTNCAKKTVVHFTGGPEIYDGVQDTVTFLRELGFERFLLLPRWNRGGALKSDIDTIKRMEIAKQCGIDNAEVEYLSGVAKIGCFFEKLWKKAINPNYCQVGDVAFNVTYDGQILGCFQDFARTETLGNISDYKNIKKIIQTQFKRTGNLNICRVCDVKQAVDSNSLNKKTDQNRDG